MIYLANRQKICYFCLIGLADPFEPDPVTGTPHACVWASLFKSHRTTSVFGNDFVQISWHPVSIQVSWSKVKLALLVRPVFGLRPNHI